MKLLRREKKLKRTNWFVFTILAVGSIAMLFPFVWMLLSSFKTAADIYSYPPKWIPSVWTTENFTKVFQMIPFGRYYINTIYTTVVQTALQIGISIIAAYSLVHLEYPGKSLFYVFMRSSMFVPMVVTMIPMYLTVASMRMLDTYAGIILPQITTAFTTFLLVSYFASIPKDLIDAAKLDGCGVLRVMTKVVVPNCSGAISTAAMFSFLGNWKSYTWPLIATTKTELRTLPIGMKYLMQESSSEYQVMMAAALMSIVPVLILFIFFSKQLVKSVTLTGMKA